MVNPSISALIPRIRSFFATQPVLKAWLFGSCSRGEETDQSDIDLLVSYDPGMPVSLMSISRMIHVLSEILGRRVDIVEDGCVQTFAQASVNHDRILIYER
ncbi:MAG: nucleotidyltransferase domain-containing protein [Bacteroides sp.]|nr:nucleotidyltransferase domain-containing protein [Bacteroides sp.]